MWDKCEKQKLKRKLNKGSQSPVNILEHFRVAVEDTPMVLFTILLGQSYMSDSQLNIYLLLRWAFSRAARYRTLEPWHILLIPLSQDPILGRITLHPSSLKDAQIEIHWDPIVLCASGSSYGSWPERGYHTLRAVGTLLELVMAHRPSCCRPVNLMPSIDFHMMVASENQLAHSAEI